MPSEKGGDTVPNEEVDWSGDPMQVQLLAKEDQIIFPVSRDYTQHDANIQFFVHNRQPGKMLDPDSFNIYLKLALVKADGSAISKTDKIAPINNFFHSLFSNIVVQMKDTTVTESGTYYPYTAYMANLVSFPPTYLEGGQGSLFGWTKDDDFDANEPTWGIAESTEAVKTASGSTNAVTSTATENDALANRLNWFFDSSGNYKDVELESKPLVVPLNQEKLIPWGVPIYVTLERNKKEFYLLKPTSNATDYKIIIKEAKLYVTYQEINAQLFDKATSLDRPIFTMPLKRPKIITRNIPANTVSTDITDVFQGVNLPTRILFGFVENEAMAGTLQKNPFNFQHFNLKELFLIKNGQMLPCDPLRPDFSKENYIRSYKNLHQGTGNLGVDKEMTISYENYGNGFTLWSFDFTGDNQGGEAIKHLKETGTLNFHFVWGSNLSKTITLVIFAEYESELRIDAHGNTTRDWDYIV